MHNLWLIGHELGMNARGKVLQLGMCVVLKLLKKLSQIAGLGLVLALAILLVRSDPEPLTRTQITALVTQLNEAAAIGVPHDFLMRKDVRVENRALLEKVESGQVLSEADSIAYRKLFQSVLAEGQNFLARFDSELSVLHDHAMEMTNNIQGQGIAGHHDHHDLSARKNFALVLNNLREVERATSSFGRIRWANAVQKDLIDLISHIGVAPHTVSVPYLMPEQQWRDEELGALFENYLERTKAAQTPPVNSPDYWEAIDQSLTEYVNLILAVQDRVMAHTSPWERRIAGRFNATQTLAPPVDLNRPLRRR
jgi:hypothetical protein